MKTTLDQLKIGQSASILKVEGEQAIRRHLFDLGLTPGAKIIMRKPAPLGDPIEFKVRQYKLSLRKSDASNVTIDI